MDFEAIYANREGKENLPFYKKRKKADTRESMDLSKPRHLSVKINFIIKRTLWWDHYTPNPKSIHHNDI